MDDHLLRWRCRACRAFLRSVIDNFTLSPDGVVLADPDHNCSEYLLDTIESQNDSSQPPYDQIEEILYSKVVPVMCFIGLIGNVLSLFMLIPRGIRQTSGRMEKFSYTGLIVLTMSNVMFCLVTIVYGFVPNIKLPMAGVSFSLVFSTYNNAVINMFILASTWLTVTLAVGRYAAVCHPLRARAAMGMTCARRSIVGVLIVCVLFNIPRLFTYSIQSVHCLDGTVIYGQYYGYMKLTNTFDTSYNWAYFVFGIASPLGLLMFCNCYLIYALRLTRRTQDRIRATKVKKETSNHMTLTLIIIIIMYILLVSPAEMINFLRQRVLADESITDAYNLAVAIVNTLQAFNFAFNFIPYCAINAHFRLTLKKLFSGKFRDGNNRRFSSYNTNERFGKMYAYNCSTTQMSVM